ncbi:MAG: hypothetical protein V4601_11740 [Pseudomonadota bacterium]
MLRRFLPIVLAAVIGQAQSPAPPSPSDSVVVTAPQDAPNQVIQDFIWSYAAPTVLSEKLPRWQTGICPVAVGLRPEAIALILARLKDNAAKAGAPLDGRINCTPNLEIVFTTTPQALLDNVRKKHPGYLGYSRRSAQADRLAVVTHPIQAWYLTASGSMLGGRMMLDSPMIIGPRGLETLYSTPQWPVSGRFTYDGLQSEFYHVFIVINPDRLVDQEIGSLADYISFMALSRVASLDHCQKLTTVMNLLLRDCAAAAPALTEGDLAFLRGLYKMRQGYKAVVQRSGIAESMKPGFVPAH